jgi:hypothetical protein
MLQREDPEKRPASYVYPGCEDAKHAALLLRTVPLLNFGGKRVRLPKLGHIRGMKNGPRRLNGSRGID